MLKKIYFIILIISFICQKSLAKSDIYIFATVNDQIITNYDIKKESEYLKILNPNLSKVNNKKVLNLGKNSLIKEIIKKKEIELFFDLNEDNALVVQYLENLYKGLNFKNEKDFEKSLSEKDNYSLDEIKQKLKIEILWNDLIYRRYVNQVKIDKLDLQKRIKKLGTQKRKEYSLSEIVFEKKKNVNLITLKDQIKSSILEIGFNNAANIYSISESSKFGGKVGWVDEKNLSEIIYNKLQNITIGEHTEVINIGKNYLILKIDEIRFKKIEIDKKEEFEKMIQFETNKQLNQFSRIYFDRVKMNYSINEK